MNFSSYLEHLRHAGDALSSAASRAGLDADVPTCPGWRVRDLVHHIGGVHRWVVANVASDDSHEVPLGDVLARDPAPQDDTLFWWYADGLDTLLRTLAATPAGKPCWTFTPVDDPLMFWARRQAQETVIHSVDADRAAGTTTHGALTPDLASDGVDELLTVLIPRLIARRGGDPAALSAQERSLAVHARDTDDRWFLRVTPTDFTIATGVEAVGAIAQCEVAGDAEQVYLMLWNRAYSPSVTVSGDPQVLEWWRESVNI